MKTIKRRAYSALLIAVFVIAGIGVYVFRFAVQGRSWVSFSANEAVYSSGRLVTGTVTDRNGSILASVRDGKRVYSDDAAIRIATLHAVGDREGNIGTGALTVFSESLSGYAPLTGVASGGGTVRLSIDAQLCAAAYEALAGRRGAVLVSDYTTGEIICMTSSMSYDPDAGFDPSDPAYSGAYLNRCISAAYPPGSVFKLLTTAASIENLPDLFERRFVCTGSTLADGSVIRCTGIHGEQSILQALANSCNCAFAELSLELGGETLAGYAARYGLSGRLSLNGVATAEGQFDAAEDGSAALAWSGVGQSTDLVTPFAMLRFVSAVAAGGDLAEPTLLAGSRHTKTALLSPETAARLREMMNYNVVYSYGAGNFPGLSLCAKSGTAELGEGTSHAWFTGFLDDPAHPYAFTVFVENGGSGARAAGPIANTVLQAAVQN